LVVVESVGKGIEVAVMLWGEGKKREREFFVNREPFIGGQNLYLQRRGLLRHRTIEQSQVQARGKARGMQANKIKGSLPFDCARRWPNHAIATGGNKRVRRTSYNTHSLVRSSKPFRVFW